MKLKILTGSGVFCLALLILLLALASCTQKTEPMPAVYPSVCGDGLCSANEVNACDIDCNLNIQAEPEPVIKTSADILAELRSRIKNYTPEERLEQSNPNPVVESDDKILVKSFTSYLPEKGFRVASRYNLLSIGENISGVIGALNKFQLNEILRSGSLRSNTQAFGPRSAMYEQFLKLRAGKVVFGYDEEADVVSTYLWLKEGEPIWDYLLELKGGIFKFFEGEQIHFLGHDYVIDQVSNDTMQIVGVTTPDTIIFWNQRGVWVNDKEIGEDVLNVTFTKDSLRIITMAPDDIKILPGTGLRNYLLEPRVLLTNRLDLTYEGLTTVPVFAIKFDKSGDRYRLNFTTNKNMSYRIPLAYLNPLKTGDDENNLVFKEGMNKSDYVVKSKDYFIITNNKKYNGLTNIIRLISIDEKNHLITFQDPALEKFLVYFEGTPGVNATANLIIDRLTHKVYVGKNNDIAVDLDGNGRISNDIVPIVTAGNAIIRINNATSNEISISVITPKEMRENTKTDLEVKIIINSEGIRVDKGSLELIEDPATDALIGMTDYGALFVLKKNVNEHEQSGDNLIIQHPLVQRFADVIIKAYE